MRTFLLLSIISFNQFSMKLLLIFAFTLFTVLVSQAQNIQQINYKTSDSSLVIMKVKLINEVDSGIYVQQYNEQLNQFGNTFFISNNRLMKNDERIAIYGEVKKKGYFDQYVSKNGTVIRVGDSLLIGKPSGNTIYNYITQMGMNGGTVLTDRKIKVHKIKSFGSTKKGYVVYLQFKGYGALCNINYDPAIESGELINQDVNLTREEAIKKLKESKELLDLQIISQEKYDSLKTELTPFILKE